MRSVERAIVGGANFAAPAIDAIEQRIAGGKSGATRQLIELFARRWQAMDRLIVDDAQAMFDQSQKSIALIEGFERRMRDQRKIDGGSQRSEG